MPTSETAKSASKLLQRARIQLFGFMCIVALVFDGANFGWGPMQIILEKNRNYGHLCSSSADSPCPEQVSKLISVSTGTSFLFVTSPFWGALIDHRGPLIGMIISSILAWIGISCLTAASFLPGSLTPSVGDPLLYVAFTCLMFVSIMSNILFVHTGLMFDKPETTQRIIAVLNTLFDAGTLTYLVLYQMAQWMDSKPGWIFIGYLSFAVVAFGGAILSWRYALQKKKDKEGANVDGVDDGESCEVPSVESINEQVDDMERADDTNDSPSGNSEEKDLPVSKLPPIRQLQTRMFILHTVYFGVAAARSTYVLATAKDFLAYLGDEDHVYLKIFTLLQPVSILGLPLMDWIINNKGYNVAMQSINILGIAHGVIQVSSNNLNVQVFGFVVFSFYRCFVFAINFGFLPTYLGIAAVGRGAGLLTLCQGIMCATSIPLANLAINHLGGNFFWPNLIEMIVLVPLFAVVGIIGQDAQRNNFAKGVQQG